MDAELITRTLEMVAERCGDPAPLVYARLFAQHPEMEALFWRDTGGLIRGQMLAVAIECLLDLAGAGDYGASLLRIERTNHDGLGVPHEVFGTFFGVMVATFRDVLGEAWTPEMAAGWQAALAAIDSLTGDPLAG
jgi:hemoglobin-like flavoprotein